MAVPPISQARTHAGIRAVRLPLLLDLVVGLLIAVALPLAILAIPNTISVVAALLPPGVSQVEMMRAHGLALPAMLLTVPLGAVAARRFRAAPIAVGGLSLLAVADAAGGFAGSATMVAVLRVLHGVGAGLLVPATLVAAAERPKKDILLPLWAGVFAASLLAAQALALWPIDDVTSWRVTLQPFPVLTVIALGLAAAYLVFWLIAGEATPPNKPSAAERGRLTLAAVPAAGIAVLAVGTTFDWPPSLVIAAAAVAVVAMLGLGAVGTFEGAGGRALAFTNVAVGLVVLPTAAQTTYVELGGLGGPGLSGLWVPFVLAVVAALAAAYVAGRVAETKAATLSGAGLAAVVAGLCAIRLLVPASSGVLLVVPFVLLAAGAAVALVSALRLAGLGAALLGLSLCFPAVLAGFLLGTGIQVTRLREVGRSGGATRQALLDGFVGALHLWALAGGFTVVGIIVFGAVLARRTSAVRVSAVPDVDAGGDVAATEPAATGAAGTVAAVPPRAPSPEDGDGESGKGRGAR
jgi:hypothetical protein